MTDITHITYPQFTLVDDEEEAVYQPDSGVLRATKCVQALCKRAQDLGATIMTGEKMQDIRECHNDDDDDEKKEQLLEITCGECP